MLRWKEGRGDERRGRDDGRGGVEKENMNESGSGSM